MKQIKTPRGLWTARHRHHDPARKLMDYCRGDCHVCYVAAVATLAGQKDVAEILLAAGRPWWRFAPRGRGIFPARARSPRVRGTR